MIQELYELIKPSGLNLVQRPESNFATIVVEPLGRVGLLGNVPRRTLSSLQGLQ